MNIGSPELMWQCHRIGDPGSSVVALLSFPGGFHFRVQDSYSSSDACQPLKGFKRKRRTHPLPFKGVTWKCAHQFFSHLICQNLVTWPHVAIREYRLKLGKYLLGMHRRDLSQEVTLELGLEG